MSNRTVQLAPARRAEVPFSHVPRPGVLDSNFLLAPLVKKIPNAVFEQLLGVRLSAPPKRAVCAPVLVNECHWPSLLIPVGHQLTVRAGGLAKTPALDVVVFLYRLVEALADLNASPVLPIVEHLS
jgi:hypothetical protein